MSSPQRSRYVERVREATRALFEDLLQANRRLCLAVSVLGADRDEPQRELDDLNRKSLRWQAEKQGVLELLEAVDRESNNFEEQFVEVERQNSNLATLFAASHALHSSVEGTLVLQAIQEVVINLIGSEEFAIVSADDAFSPRALFGVSSDRLRGLSVRSGIIGRAVSEGRPLALPCGVPVDATGVRVCIPLQVAEKTLGFVLISASYRRRTKSCRWTMSSFPWSVRTPQPHFTRPSCMPHEQRPVPDSGPVVADVHLAPGQLSVKFGPGRLRTILGSCVSVCLWDGRLGLGGMNHFLLPRSASAYVTSLRYGDTAMVELVNGLSALGSRPSQLSACVYGGASVLAGLSDAWQLGERNVAFAMDWLTEAGIAVEARDVLGRLARRVEFDLTSGVSRVRLLGAQ